MVFQVCDDRICQPAQARFRFAQVPEDFGKGIVVDVPLFHCLVLRVQKMPSVRETGPALCPPLPRPRLTALAHTVEIAQNSLSFVTIHPAENVFRLDIVMHETMLVHPGHAVGDLHHDVTHACEIKFLAFTEQKIIILFHHDSNECEHFDTDCEDVQHLNNALWLCLVNKLSNLRIAPDSNFSQIIKSAGHSPGERWRSFRISPDLLVPLEHHLDDNLSPKLLLLVSLRGVRSEHDGHSSCREQLPSNVPRIQKSLAGLVKNDVGDRECVQRATFILHLPNPISWNILERKSLCERLVVGSCVKMAVVQVDDIHVLNHDAAVDLQKWKVAVLCKVSGVSPKPV
mmetsp:Transcript_28866/g.68404  ORF Transcript_28866/g.68404 Transcript_28866/m.68404 type:complete len:343 (-) Transcript_28866:350-1378(-)